MEQIWIAKAGGPENLQLRSADDPVPAPGEIVIDVRSAGVNFADVLARMGRYPDAPPIPCVVGYEVAGTVAEVGPDAPFARGDRVVALTHFGGYSTKVRVPANQVFRMPDGMSYSEAAAIPVSYFTAYLAAIRFGNVQTGERVLVHNAGGGAGVAAVQLCIEAGAIVYGTASAWKHDRLRELGVGETIDYRSVDWVDEVLRRTDGAGVHVIVDPIGGKNLSRDLRVLAPLGRLIAFGFSEPVRNGSRPFLATLRSLLRMPRPHMLTLLNNNWSIAGLNMGHLWSEIDRLRAAAEAVLASYDRGHVRPVIAAEIPFHDAAEAHRTLEDRKNLGKVVLVR
ncbi:MAG: zinc-binding dehydrogenase [Spirochaetota bacterium]